MRSGYWRLQGKDQLQVAILANRLCAALLTHVVSGGVLFRRTAAITRLATNANYARKVTRVMPPREPRMIADVMEDPQRVPAIREVLFAPTALTGAHAHAR